MFTAQEISSISIAVLLLSAFISIFYFTYVTSVEAAILEDQIKYIVESLVNDTKILPPEYLATLKNQIANMNADMADADATAAENNAAIFNMVIKIISVATVAVCAGVYIASRYWEFSLWEVAKENLVIIVFIALTEYIFITYFAKKFMSGDPNYVRHQLITQLQELPM